MRLRHPRCLLRRAQHFGKSGKTCRLTISAARTDLALLIRRAVRPGPPLIRDGDPAGPVPVRIIHHEALVLAKVLSTAVIGLDAHLVEVEADLGGGLPQFSLVGLPDTTVRESRDRVRAAL